MFTVTAFRIHGATLVPEAQLQAALAPWLNRPITFAELEQAVEAVAGVYGEQGWLARPQLPVQELSDGVVTINVTESRLGQVRIDDGGLMLGFDRERLTQAATARQQPGQPLRPEDIERAISLLNETPGLRAGAVLAAGQSPGETDIVLLPVDQPLWNGSAQLDNEGVRSTGAVRLSGNVALNSPSGIGDQLLLSGNTSGAGNEYGWLSYSLPLGNDGWRVGANASALQYRLEGEFAALGAYGSAQTFGLYASYPLLRTRLHSLTLTLALGKRDFLNKASGQVVSDKRLTGVGAALGGNEGDFWGGGGFTSWGANLSSGDVKLSASPAYEAADAAGPRTAGRYTRLAWSLARLQPVSERSALWFSGSGQFASKNLDSAEKFSLGGFNGVRAYPSLEGTGDTGWLVNAEWRLYSQPGLQWSAYYDIGQVRVNRDQGFVGAPTLNHVMLQGVGVGLNWTQPGRFAVVALLARRVGSNPLANPTTGKDSDGSMHTFRAWIGLAAYF